MSGILGGMGAVNVAGIQELSVGLQNINQQLSNLFRQIGIITISLPSLPGDSLFGNPSGSPALPSPITLGTGLAFSGSVLNAAIGEWSAGIVTALGANLSIVGTTLTAASSQWSAGTTTALAPSLQLSGTILGVRAVASFQATPGNPAGTASTVGVMMGLAGAITPAVSGIVLLMVSGTIFNPGAIADGGKVQLRFGSGSAPANAASLTGTAVGGLVQYTAATTTQTAPFSVQAVVSGLTVSTTYWIDVGLAAITGGTATISDVSVSAVELT